MQVATLDSNGQAEHVTADVVTTDLPALYDKHYRSLVRLTSMYVGDRETSEEIVQDAFVKLMSGRYRFEPGKEGPYLRSIVLNGARSTLRKRKVRRAKKPEPPGPVASAEVGGVNLIERERMLELVRSLPKKQADVLILRYYLDLSEKEIAETLGIAPGSVKSHAHRGLSKLNARLQDDDR